MITRAFMVLVLAFWLVMTVLLVRFTYFPEGSQFAEVPPRVVLKLFLDQGSKNNTMHLYHYDQKIGHASMDSRVLRFIDGTKGPPKGHVLRVNGLLEKGAIQSIPDAILWRLEIQVQDLERMSLFKGQLRLQESGMVVDFAWQAGERAPKISLSQRGAPATDTLMLQLLLNQVLGGGGVEKLTNPPAAADQPPREEVVQLKTREAKMNLGGQKRSGYALEIGGLDRLRLKAFFTEAGELALVTLPDGYRLIEPVIFGLTPDYGEEEEE